MQDDTTTAVPPAEPAPSFIERAAAAQGGSLGHTASERPDRTGSELNQALAHGERVRDSEQTAALDFFLSDAEVNDDDLDEEMWLNIGGPEREDGGAEDPAHPPRWMKWVVRPIGEDVIDAARKMSERPRRGRRRRGAPDIDTDNAMVAARIVAAATVEPDPAEIAQRLNIADPALAIRRRFDRLGKGGLVTQISGRVLSISGYDEDDVRDAIGPGAAGN